MNLSCYFNFGFSLTFMYKIDSYFHFKVQAGWFVPGFLELLLCGISVCMFVCEYIRMYTLPRP